jgi:uncharacterized protein YdaU (DUF1376 family)
VNYFRFHIGDYAAATRHLSWDEDCAYRRLLDLYYRDEKPLIGDLTRLYRLVGATTEHQQAAVRVVLEEFFEPTGDTWANPRADLEISDHRGYLEKQRASGRASADKRSLNGGTTTVQRSLNHGSTVVQPPTPIPTTTNKHSSNVYDASPAEPPQPPKKVSQAKRRTSLTETSPPDLWRQYATERVPDMDVDETFCNFRDHHLKLGSVMADWGAAWRTWIQNCLKGYPYVRRVRQLETSSEPTFSPYEWQQLQAARKASHN